MPDGLEGVKGDGKDRRERDRDDGKHKRNSSRSPGRRRDRGGGDRNESSHRSSSHRSSRSGKRSRSRSPRGGSDLRSPRSGSPLPPRGSSRSRSPKRNRRSRSPKRGSRGSRKSPSRSPSPVEVRRRERRNRSNNWDKAPPGFEGMNVQQVAKINPSVLTPLLTSQNPQQTRQARRLYVGNVPAQVSEQELASFFNEKMIAAQLSMEQNPVIAVQMNYEKSFAFVEFKVTEDATRGMSLDGVTLRGQALKVRRPKDYQPPPSNQQATSGPATSSAPTHIPGIVSTNVPDSPNKIFVGGLPSYLSEDQVKDLLSAYGQLKSFNLVKDPLTGNSKGYAFFEYLDDTQTDKACAGLNGMKLQEKTLLVQRASFGAKAGLVGGGGGGAMTSQQLQTALGANPTAAQFLNLQIPSATILSQLPGMYGGFSQPPTSILMLLNMVAPEDLNDQDDLNDVKNDVGEECSNYGRVVSIQIPPPQDDNAGTSKIYVEFDRSESAKAAQLALAGRKYNNRMVITSYYPEEDYHNSNLI